MTLSKRLLTILTACSLAVASFAIAGFAADDDDIVPRSIKITTDDRELEVGKTLLIDYEITPSDANAKTDVTWESSNDDILEVDNTGLVTAVSPGTASITVKTENGKRYKITITVPGKSRNTSSDNEDEYYSSSRSSSSRAQSASSSKASSTGTGNVELSGTVPRETLVEAVKKAGSKNATLSGYASVSADSLKAAAGAGKANVNFDTKSGKSVMGRLVINPAGAAKLNGTIKLGVYHKDSKTSAVQSRYDQNYLNKVDVVKCDQSNYGMTVTIKVKVGKNVNAKNLKFYSYDTSSGTHSAMTVTNVSVDDNGYVSFNTTRGGTIIISQGALERA